MKLSIFKKHNCKDFITKTLHAGGALWRVAGLGVYYHIRCSKCNKIWYQECRPITSCRNCIHFKEGIYIAGIHEVLISAECYKCQDEIINLNGENTCEHFRKGKPIRLKDIGVEVVVGPTEDAKI